MSTSMRWIIAIGSVIAAIFIALPIIYYRLDFHGLDRSSNPADWGTFGDYIGGILNPIISLLTLIVTILIAATISKIEKRNHEENIHYPVKPLLTIVSKDFFSSDISRIGLTVDADFYSYSKPESPSDYYDYLTRQFNLIVSNKGLGVATEVNVTFEIDLLQLVHILKIDHENIKTSISEIRTDEERRKFIIISVESETYNYQGSFKLWDSENFYMDIIEKNQNMDVQMPGQMLDSFKLFNLLRRLRNQDIEFPISIVTLNYKNIFGKNLKSKFRLGLIHRRDFAAYSMFGIRQEEIHEK